MAARSDELALITGGGTIVVPMRVVLWTMGAVIVALVSGYLYLLGWLGNQVVNLGREVSAMSVEVESNGEMIDANGEKIDANGEKIDANGEKTEALRDDTNRGFERLEDIILDEGR